MAARKLERITAAQALAIRRSKAPSPGKDGVSVVKTAVDDDGFLMVSLSDGSEHNAGKVAAEVKCPPHILECRVAGSDLIVVMSDGTQHNAGKVVAPPLKPNPPIKGDKGDSGISLLSAAVSLDGDLVIKMTDGTREIAGRVVFKGKDGSQGVGVSSGSIDSGGRLILKLSNGRHINAGKVIPEKTPGAKGNRGPSGKNAPNIIDVEQKNNNFWLVLDNKKRLGPITLPEVQRSMTAGFGGGGLSSVKDPLVKPQKLVIEDYTVTPEDYTVIAEAIETVVNISLPPAADKRGRVLNFVSKYSSTKDVVLTGTINGDVSGFTIISSESVSLQSVDDGAGSFEWVVYA